MTLPRAYISWALVGIATSCGSLCAAQASEPTVSIATPGPKALPAASPTDTAETASLNGSIHERLAKHDQEESQKNAAYQQARAAYEAKLSENQKQQEAASAALAQWRQQTAAAEAEKAAWTQKFGAQAKLGKPPEKTPGWYKPAAQSGRANCDRTMTGSLVKSAC